MSYLRRLRATRQLRALSARVVDASCEPLLARVLPGILGLTAAEAKGYIRGWSRSIVRHQVAIAVPVQWQQDPRVRDHVAQQATKEVVNRVYWEAMRARMTHQPADRREAA